MKYMRSVSSQRSATERSLSDHREFWRKVGNPSNWQR